VERTSLDFDSLIGRWRSAFAAGQAAVLAAGHELPAGELREQARRLADERIETARLLDALARDLGAKPQLVRLVTSPWDARRLMGVPPDAAACVFDLDAVLVGGAALHAEAWKETLDPFVSDRIERTGRSLALFDVQVDYPTHIHGRPRLDGVREFLASRAISLPDGAATDPPGAETVHGLANRKGEALLRLVDESGVRAFAGARLYLELAHDAGLRCAVVSASTNTETMLERARLTDLVDERVDGSTMASEGLRSKPAPDTLLAACRRIGADPVRTVVFEATRDGVAAAHAGGFELVVRVGAGGGGRAPRPDGADLVVSDLGELLERSLAA